jgi:small-conductance mechanosensitive channel
MSDVQRGLFRSLADGARERLKAGKSGSVSWARRVAPAPVLLRLAVALPLFLAAEVAVPADWAAAGGYIAAAALFAAAAALLPAGVAPTAAILFVLTAWVLNGALNDGDPSLWTAALIACLLYTAHSAAAVTQRFRTTTAMDGEIMLTWARHLGLVLASTLALAGTLALFTAYFTGLAAGLVITAGIVAAVTVIYVLARSLHNRP